MAPPTGRVGHPVGAGNSRRINAAIQNRRTGSLRQLFLQRKISRRVAAVESDGKLLSGFFHRSRQFTALLLRECHRLFDEDVLARTQCGESLRSVLLIAAYDHDCLDFRILQNFA